MKRILDAAFFRKYQKILLVVFIAGVLIALRMMLLAKPDNSIKYTVIKDSLVDTVQVTGTYKVASQVAVYSPTNGIIKKVFVSNNEQVKKDDKLFEVESTATAEEKAAAYASYQSAVSSLRTAENARKTSDSTMWVKQKTLLDAKNAVNYKNDHDINPSTKKEYTSLEEESLETALVQAEKDFRAAEEIYKTSGASIASAQAAVRSALIEYNKTQNSIVKATTDGTIQNFLGAVGDEVTAKAKNESGSQQTSQNEESPVLLISNLESPYVSASINEAYMTRIAEGQPVTIVFDSLKSQTFSGSVQSVDSIGTDNSGVISFAARIISADIPSTVKANMTALLTIETLRKDDVLTIPNSALIEIDGKMYVQKVVNGPKPEQVAVTVGTRGLVKTEIMSGLVENDVVISNPVTE
jgi:HlyD family secretion protein